MNLKDIEALIKFVQKTGVSEVSIEQKDLKITIKTHGAPAQVIQASIPVASSQAQAPTPSAMPVATSAAVSADAPKPKASEESKYITIKSPMIGTFYRSSSPDKAVFD